MMLLYLYLIYSFLKKQMLQIKQLTLTILTH